MSAPLIAIVGRPNVGKSTLYNRLVGGRPALVHDTPGLTRDRRYGELEYYGHPLRIVDTGGLDPEAERDVIGAGIHRQAHRAVEECDAVILVVDARAGLTPLDHEVATMLRRTGKPVLLAANKLDTPKRDDLAAELYGLGMGEVYPISAAHGRGVDDLIEAVIATLGLTAPAPAPAADEQGMPAHPTGEARRHGEAEVGPLRVAFIGKPNAGKSSLVNRLVGVERSLVHHEPGTTTDPVDTPFDYAGRDYILVDTAGIRRRARIDEDTEKIAVSMALGQIKRADVVVLVIDGSLGPSEQDTKLVGAVEEAGRGLVIALNKSDLLEGPGAGGALLRRSADLLHFVSYAPQVLISAKRGEGVSRLMDTVNRVAAEHGKRVPTSELNRFFAEVVETHPPPIYQGRPVRAHYITQAAVRPPTFLFFANRPKGISPAYRRYLINQLRARYRFEGSPLRVVVRARRGHEARPGARKRKGKRR